MGSANETTLHNNVVSHSMSPYPEWFLHPLLQYSAHRKFMSVGPRKISVVSRYAKADISTTSVCKVLKFCIILYHMILWKSSSLATTINIIWGIEIMVSSNTLVLYHYYASREVTSLITTKRRNEEQCTGNIDGLVQERRSQLLTHWSYIFLVLTHRYMKSKINYEAICETWSHIPILI